MSSIREELLRFGRRRARENENIAPLLDEVIARRFDKSRRHVVTDACFLAHATGLYDRCVELFLSCARETSLELHLFECVVDSCYQLGADFLPRLFDIVDLMVVRIGRDACSQLAVLRAFWLCCVAMRDAQAGAGDGRRRAPPQQQTQQQQRRRHPSEYRQACARLYSVLSHALSGASAAPFTSGVSGPSGSGGGEGGGQQAASPSLPAGPAAGPLPPFDDLLQETLMTVRYASGGDAGEADFYRRVVFRRFVAPGQLEAWTGSGVKARRTIFISLVRSTQKGVQLAVARTYFEHFRGVWAAQQVAVDEQVIHMYLQALADARAFEELMQEAATLGLGPPEAAFPSSASSLAKAHATTPLHGLRKYVPSNSVVALVMRAAGEHRRLDVCLWCVDVLLGGGGGHPDNAPPTPYEMFTCLIALAKCTAPNFFQILQSCSAADLVKLSDEELLYVRLQYLRNSLAAKEQIDQLPEAVMVLTASPTPAVGADAAAEDAAILSPRNKNLILHVLQSTDSDKFMQVLRAFCRPLGDLAAADRSWGALALAWVDGRRVRATPGDRRFVRDLLKALDMTSVAAPSAEPYRGTLLNFMAIDSGADEPAESPAFKPFTKLRTACLDASMTHPPPTLLLDQRRSQGRRGSAVAVEEECMAVETLFQDAEAPGRQATATTEQQTRAIVQRLLQHELSAWQRARPVAS